MPKLTQDENRPHPTKASDKQPSQAAATEQRRIKLPEMPDDISSGQPGVEDLPHGKQAAKEASRPRDD